MRKKFFALAIGIAAAMMTGGCSGKGTDKPAETSAEGAKEQQESTMSDSEKESLYAEEGLGEEDMEDVPLKITGTILEIGDGSILVDSGSDTEYMGEVMLMIDPENTLVLDGADGFPVELESVEMGNFEAYLGPAMTMSLPPQSTPYVVIVNIPEGGQAPQYVVADGKVDEGKGRKTLTGVDETEYTLARSVDIQPYLTRNIVQLEDIDSGSRCLVWTNEEEEVDRIVLFAE